MKSYSIDGAAMTDRRAAHAELARALAFPEYYGGNLDALWDMISTMDGEVTLKHTAEMLNHLGGYGCSLLKTFFDAAQEDGFTFRAE